MHNKLENKRKINFILAKLYHFFFSEKFKKKINFNFDNSKNRLDLIQAAIDKKKYQSYLESGCDQNQIFGKINIKNKVVIDPVSGGTLRCTSDDFFSNNSMKFDCIFIDGLHEYKQVSRDIRNSLNFLNNDGVILLHDCLPDSISKQYVPRTRYAWNGDVWKAIVEVRTLKDLNVCTCMIDEGVSVIKKKRNEELLKLDISDFSKLSYEFFYNNYKNIMRLKSYDDVINFL